MLIQEVGPLVFHVKGSSMTAGNCDLELLIFVQRLYVRTILNPVVIYEKLASSAQVESLTLTAQYFERKLLLFSTPCRSSPS